MRANDPAKAFDATTCSGYPIPLARVRVSAGVHLTEETSNEDREPKARVIDVPPFIFLFEQEVVFLHTEFHRRISSAEMRNSKFC